MIVNGDCEHKTDAELVKLTLKDADWYGCLAQRYEGRLARYIGRISGASKEDIEDLLQEVFLAVYRNLNDFDPKLKFSSWVYRITHNKVISHYRKTQARPQIIDGEEGEKLLAIVKDESNVHEEVSSKITGESVHGLLVKLDKKYQEVLVLKYLEEKDYNEISDILKKSVGTVGTLLNRAKVKLQEIIKNQGIKI